MIVALDLGHSTGLAAGGGPLPPEFATIYVGPIQSADAIGPALVKWRRELAPRLIRFKPTEVLIEAALPVAAVNNIAAQRAGAPRQAMGRELDVVFQYMLAGVARMLCTDLGLPCANANVGKVRGYFLRGIPHETPALEKISTKDRVMMAAVKRGWRCATIHEADAAAILAWRLAQTAGGVGV